ncbi:hypothetical protein C0991_009790 [Blastosporella zonata]|nr:hypothetical protein C0991_009790 [Blastosporella zonata]
MQTSYRIQVSSSQEGGRDVWDTDIVSSDASVADYAGPSLSPGTRYMWTLNVGTTAGLGAVASAYFTTDYPSFHDSSLELARRQITDFGTLLTAFKTGTWIWTVDGAPPLFLAPPGDRFFRRTYSPPAGKTAILAEVIITADNKYSLFVNGTLVGASPADVNSWENAQGYMMPLYPGPVLFAVEGTNAPTTTGAANAAGLLAAIRITHSDGTQVIIGTDRQWVSNSLPVPAFQQPETDDSTWVPAILIAKFGSGPWASSVTAPTVLTTVNLPAPVLPSSSSILPSSTLSPLSLTTGTISLSSTTSLLSSTTSSAPITTPSTQTVTQTSFTEEATAPAASTSPASASSSTKTKPALVGATIGGVLGAFALLGLVIIFWRRQKKAQDDITAADFDTWIPAPHAAASVTPNAGNSNSPFMSQSSDPSRSPASSSTLRQPHYGNTSNQSQVPYRYPPPSAMMAGAPSASQYGGSNHGTGTTEYDHHGGGGGAAPGRGYNAVAYGAAPQAAGAYNAQTGRYGDNGYSSSGYATVQEYGSSTQLVPPQSGGGGNVPLNLTPASRGQGVYSPAGGVQSSNSYDRRYY